MSLTIHTNFYGYSTIFTGRPKQKDINEKNNILMEIRDNSETPDCYYITRHVNKEAKYSATISYNNKYVMTSRINSKEEEDNSEIRSLRNNSNQRKNTNKDKQSPNKKNDISATVKFKHKSSNIESTIDTNCPKININIIKNYFKLYNSSLYLTNFLAGASAIATFTSPLKYKVLLYTAVALSVLGNIALLQCCRYASFSAARTALCIYKNALNNPNDDSIQYEEPKDYYLPQDFKLKRFLIQFFQNRTS